MSGESDEARSKLTHRPIDRLRNSGGVGEIGTMADGAIVAMISTREKLYFVKTHSIYGFQFADRIDPNRQNPNIPNTQQKEFSIGSENSDVSRVLLTADLLLKKTALGQTFDVQLGLESAFELLRDIVALRGKLIKLEADQREAQSTHAVEVKMRRTFCLPSIENIEAQCDAFAQKAAHVINGLESLARLFYPALTSKWIDALIQTAKKEHGIESELARYLEQSKPFLLFVNDDMRNLIEHPKQDRFIKVYNFRLLPSGDLAVPSVEIVRSDQPVETHALGALMKFITEKLVNICEGLLVRLCDSNIKGPGPFSALRVIEVAPDKRNNPYVRFSYGYYDGQTMIPISVS